MDVAWGGEGREAWAGVKRASKRNLWERWCAAARGLRSGFWALLGLALRRKPGNTRVSDSFLNFVQWGVCPGKDNALPCSLLIINEAHFAYGGLGAGAALVEAHTGRSREGDWMRGCGTGVSRLGAGERDIIPCCWCVLRARFVSCGKCVGGPLGF